MSLLLTILGFLASQAVALLAGVLLLVVLWRERHGLPLGLMLPSCWMVGTGALAIERLLLAQLGVAWALPALLAPWLALVGLAARRVRAESPRMSRHDTRWADYLHNLRQQDRGQLALDVGAVLLIVGWTLALMVRTFGTPLIGWDALAMWIFKGHVFYVEGTVPFAFFTDPHYAGPYNGGIHLDYPLLVPLTVARIYSWMGDNDVIVKGWWALLAGASAAGIYFGLSGFASRRTRLVGVALVIGLPAMTLHAADDMAGYAELPLAVFFLYAALFLYRWLFTATWIEFGLSAFFFGMAGFTKNEGLVLVIAGLGLLLVLCLVLRRFRLAPVALSLGVALLMVVPWQVEKVLLNIPSDLQPSVGAIVGNFGSRIGPITQYIFFNATDARLLGPAWYVLPVLALGALFFARRRWLSTAPLLLLLVAQLAGTVVAYLTTPYDLYWHLGTSADRLVFQPTLLVVLLGTLYLDMLLRPALLPASVVPSTHVPSLERVEPVPSS